MADGKLDDAYACVGRREYAKRSPKTEHRLHFESADAALCSAELASSSIDCLAATSFHPPHDRTTSYIEHFGVEVCFHFQEPYGDVSAMIGPTHAARASGRIAGLIPG